jgi:CRP/FNR family transcriptional regulator, cyclic AMP receptor protein
MRTFCSGSAEGTSLATYQPRDIIFSQGDEADSVMCLLDGAVKLSVSCRSGKEGVVAMLETGAFFGEGALVGRSARVEMASAINATRVRIIPNRQMIRLLREHQEFSDWPARCSCWRITASQTRRIVCYPVSLNRRLRTWSAPRGHV